MNAPVTQWFGGEVKPKRKGVYQREYADGFGIWFCYWDGDKFCAGASSPEKAATYTPMAGIVNLPWRGLAVKP